MILCPDRTEARFPGLLRNLPLKMPRAGYGTAGVEFLIKKDGGGRYFRLKPEL
jgi:hypothetical protein